MKNVQIIIDGSDNQCNISCKPIKYQGPLITGFKLSCKGAFSRKLSNMITDKLIKNVEVLTHRVLACSKMIMTRKIEVVAM